MADSNSGARLGITRLILVPALITLAITIIRLVGELKHWPSPWFNTSAGGGGAIIGISWLPIIFGPYFAMKLAGAGERDSSLGKAIGMTVIGLVVMILGGFLLAKSGLHGALMFVAAAVLLIAALVPLAGWSALTKTLLAYAYAARIPVLIVMYFALAGNWGTHYDAAPSSFATVGFATKFVALALLPQMCLWIAYTVILGSLIGIGVTALFRRGKPAVQATA